MTINLMRFAIAVSLLLASCGKVRTVSNSEIRDLQKRNIPLSGYIFCYVGSSAEHHYFEIGNVAGHRRYRILKNVSDIRPLNEFALGSDSVAVIAEWP